MLDTEAAPFCSWQHEPASINIQYLSILNRLDMDLIFIHHLLTRFSEKLISIVNKYEEVEIARTHLLHPTKLNIKDAAAEAQKFKNNGSEIHLFAADHKCQDEAELKHYFLDHV